MTKRKLPIGIQTFREIREENCYYVDKTAHIQQLIDEGKHYFLSRPRRFGKSLFLDTLKELFEGNEALFEGLHIHDHWDWSVRYPVLRFDFSSGNYQGPDDLRKEVAVQLDALENEAKVSPRDENASARLRHLMKVLHERSGQRVVLLVDENDKPILDALAVPEVARANRNFLHSLYATTKDCDAHIHFTFLTGVSQFSKASIFSGLNNLINITLDTRYSAICGYTDADLDTVFAPELPGLDREEVRDWYNGYSWRGDETVYNPFDILAFFNSREFGACGFKTGTPTFLIEILLDRGVSSIALDNMLGTNALLSTIDLDHIATEALLFQTGYLTIHQTEPRGGDMYYRLSYPNREVRQSLNKSLLNHLTGDPSQRTEHRARLYDLLLINDFASLESLFKAFFASIPYQWHTNNEIANYEGYYASVFYSYFASVGFDIVVEDSGSDGRLDMAVRFNDNVYLFEFKVVELASKGAAMAQLQEKEYADKYRGLGQPIHLIAVEFSKDTRNITAFEVEGA